MLLCLAAYGAAQAGTPWADVDLGRKDFTGILVLTDLKEKMTKGMHYSNRSAIRRLEYNQSEPTFFVCTRTATREFGDRWYSLGWFTHSLETSPSVAGDCRDFAGALTLAMLANGLTAECLWMENVPADNDPVNNFTTTLICNANKDSNDPALYSQRSFNFHLVNRASGTTQDSAVAYYYSPSGSVHKNPAWGWAEDEHWQQQVGGTTYGLCSSTESAWTPRPAFVPLHLNPFIP